MEKAVINFSNGKTLEISVEDFLVPVVKTENDGKTFATRLEPVDMYWHVHDGLIPAILDILCCYDFFFVNHDISKAYGSKAVVSVEQL